MQRRGHVRGRGACVVVCACAYVRAVLCFPPPPSPPPPFAIAGQHDPAVATSLLLPLSLPLVIARALRIFCRRF